jgi:hypothetical protein
VDVRETDTDEMIDDEHLHQHHHQIEVLITILCFNALINNLFIYFFSKKFLLGRNE